MIKNEPIRSCVVTLARFIFSKMPRVPFHRRVSCYERSQFWTECLRNSSKRILTARARGKENKKKSCVVENAPLEKLASFEKKMGGMTREGKTRKKLERVFMEEEQKGDTRTRKEKHGGASIPVQCVLRDSIVR